MEDIIYHVFEGVLILSIFGLLAFSAKKFLASKSLYKWRGLSTSILIALWLIVLYYFYWDMSSPYVRQHSPEDSMILGSHACFESDMSYWSLDSNKVVSMPLYVRPNRLLTLYISFDRSSFEVRYASRNAQHMLTVTNNKALVVNQMLTEEMALDSSRLSSFTNVDEESMIPFRFRVSAPVKMYSYEVQRVPAPRVIFFRMVLIALITGAAFSLIIFAVNAFPKAE